MDAMGKQNAPLTRRARTIGLALSGLALLFLSVGFLRTGGLILASLLALMAYWRSRRKMAWSRSKRVDVATLTLLAASLAALAVALPHGK